VCVCVCVCVSLSGLRGNNKPMHKQTLGRRIQTKIERNLLYWQLMLIKIMYVMRHEIVQV